MKKIIVLPFFILITCCCSKKNIGKVENMYENKVGVEEKNNCPEDGVCTIEILKNKSLDIKKDEFDHIYFQEIDNNQTSIVKFQYQRNNEKGYSDGNYREEVLFEIINSDRILKLSDKDIQKTKMLFGRHCYCKGQAGYFLVQKGDLDLTKIKEEYNINLQFTITEVPQIINKINTSIK